MKSLVFFGLVLLGMSAGAAPGGLFSSQTQASVVLDDALSKVKPGSVVIIGENHGLKTHQTQQLAILQILNYSGLKVSVGMEFFAYPDQPLVNRYRSGRLNEDDFLKAIGWGSLDFSYYRDQVAFPDRSNGGRTVALNAPRSLTGKIAKMGMGSLTPEELAILPPNFTVGRESYKTRFLENVPHQMPAADMDRLFTAQSVWDDTMAWKAKEFLDKNPKQVLVIIVGEFHVQYGGGLPDRLKARGVSSVLTFSQVDTRNFNDEDLPQLIAPSSRDGVRADYLWLAPAEQ